jgi:general secretion pathway protein D
VQLRLTIFLLALLLVLLTGCATPGSPRDVEKELEPTAVPATSAALFNDQDGPINVGKGKGKDSSVPRAKSEIEPGSGRFINEEAARPREAATSGEGQITFNFDNTPIQAVIQNILGELLKENYTIAPGVQGNVTFSTSRPIKPEQAVSVLEMLLSWTKNALVFKDGRYIVTTVAEAIPGNLTPTLGLPKLPRGYSVRVFPLHHISPVEMAKLLKPYARPEAFVQIDPARSMLVLSGNPSELENYQRTIDIFDVDWLKGMSVGVYTLERVEVATIMPELEKVFGTAGESPMAGLFRFLPIDRMNAIIVITASKEYLEEAEKWLHRLDMGGGENGTQLYVYDVKNVKAVDLSESLNEIFTGSRGSSGRKTSNKGNVAPGLQSVQITGINDKSKKAEAARAAAAPATQTAAPSGTGTATGAAGEDVRITAIEENNQLLVLAVPMQWDSILAAIKRLDTPPLQVKIETKILEVTLTGDLSLGVQWYFDSLVPGQPGDEARGLDRTLYRHAGALGQGTAAAGKDALFYSYVNANMQVALRALESDSKARVLSAPSLVVLNNKEAKINVGQQIPVIQNFISGVGVTQPINSSTTGSTTGTTTPASNGFATTGSVQFRDTGVLLTVKPRVNPGGLVYLEVSQEVSKPTGTDSTGNALVSKRTIDTEVAVQSGQTVLLGGLISDDGQEVVTGLPFISRIPILGSLFGTTSHKNQRTELIVLITPVVISNSDEARQVTEDYQRRFESLAPLRKKKTEDKTEIDTKK